MRKASDQENIEGTIKNSSPPVFAIPMADRLDGQAAALRSNVPMNSPE